MKFYQIFSEKENPKNNTSSDIKLRRKFNSKENKKHKNNVKSVKTLETDVATVDLKLEENQQPACSKSKKRKENSNICSICRDGGNLLLCDKCPKSFHTQCLKLNKFSLPENEWYCPACLPKVERQKTRESDFEQKRKLRNEKKKLWRLKRREEHQKKALNNDNNINASETSNIKKIDSTITERLSEELKKFENKQLSVVSDFPIKHKNHIRCLSAKKNQKSTPENITNNSKKFMDEFIYKTAAKGQGRSDLDNNQEINDKKEKKLNNTSNEDNIAGSKALEISENQPSQNQKNTNFNKIPSTNAGQNSSSSNKNDANKISDLKDKHKIVDLNSIDVVSFNSLIANKAKTTQAQIKYPIDDSELYGNPEKYNLPREYFNKPRGQKSFIPDIYYTKVIKIWDVLNTFNSIFNLSKIYNPDEMYVALNYYGEKELEIINDIHVSFIKIIYEEVKNKQLSDFFDDKNLLMFKIAYENTSLKNFKYMWLEVFQFIVVSPFFSLLATDEQKQLRERLSILKYYQYNLLAIDEKLLILEFFCNIILDTHIIRELIKNEIEKKRELKAEIASLELQLKSFESRKKELERQEKFTQPKLKIETLNKKLDSLVEENPKLTRPELTRLRKEMELEREQFKSVKYFT